MKIVLLVLFLSITFQCISQTGKITGIILSSQSGLPLNNATIKLLETNKIITSDINGKFSFSKLAEGTYSIESSYSGFNSKIIEEIKVRNNDVTVININLDIKVSTDSIKVVAVRRKANAENTSTLLIEQKNRPNFSDGISGEGLKKTSARTVSDAVKLVSGASIQDERFAIIRGLNDRYNSAFINLAPLPSTESDRKAFAFDIFPSNILDNLVIFKTATPDMNAEFAGGNINLTTKGIPSKGFTSILIGSTYNSLATFKNRLQSETIGSTDYIGIDDGKRKVIKELPDIQTLKSATFAQRAEYATFLGNYKWGFLEKNTLPNYSFQIVKGITSERNGKEFLGALASISYSKNFSTTFGERNTFDYDINTGNIALAQQKGKFLDSVYNDETVVSLLGNVSLKINNKNNISWKNNFSINADNKVITRNGFSDFDADPLFATKEKVRWFTSNQIFNSQLIGEHILTKSKLKLNWIGSYAKVIREIPNLARTAYVGYEPDLQANISNATISPSSGSGTMFFSNSNESIKSLKIDVTQPFTFRKDNQNFLKAGLAIQNRSRAFNARLIGFAPYNGSGVFFDFDLLSLPENKIFVRENLGKMANGRGGFILNEGSLPNFLYDASSNQLSGFVMADQRFFKKLRLIYGARVEKFNQKLNSFKDVNVPTNINTTITDILPSVNFIYSLNSKMNLRLAYSKTINRPEFRELAPYLFYDFATQFTYEGFDTLQRAIISNYDIRYEFYPGKAQMFSVSGFYKNFINPIEIVSNPVFDNLAIYSNAQSAKVYGVEAEFRTLLGTLVGTKKENIFNKITWSANAAYILSSVKLGAFGFYDPSLLVTDRALQGQSPYIINTSLNYNYDKIGLSATVSYNRVGDRISIAGTITDADIYEKARSIIDFQIAKSFLKNKNLEVKITGKDLLSQNLVFYFDFDKNKKFSTDDRKFSSMISPKAVNIAISFKF